MFRLRRRGSGPSDEPPAVPPARGYGGGVGGGGGEERSAWAGRRGQGRQARAFICVRRRVGRAEVVRCACAARQCQLETWKGWVDGWLDRSIDQSSRRRGEELGQARKAGSQTKGKLETTGRKERDATQRTNRGNLRPRRGRPPAVGSWTTRILPDLPIGTTWA